jgi:hypothetical protein
MSATDAVPELASPDSRRPLETAPSTVRRLVLVESSSQSASGPAAGGTHRVPDPHQAPTPELEQPTAPETWWESFQRAERARAGRLRSVWQMAPAQRVAAMRRGDLTYEQLAAWSARHPEQVPTVHGEFEWIAAKLPGFCE